MRTQSAPVCPDVADYEPFHPAHLADPYPFWSKVRREQPVFYIPSINAWGVSRYKDVLEVIRDPATYSSAQMLDVIGFREEWRSQVENAFPPAYPGLINNDPPDHARVRKLVQKAFTPRVVAGREREVRRLADELIAGFAGRGHAEVMREYAAPFSTQVVSAILGFPPGMWPRLKRWADEDIQLLNPTLEDDLRRQYTESSGEWFTCLAELVEERRAEPQDDLITALIRAQVDDEPVLTTREVIAIAAQLVVGGHETVNNQLGLTFLQLLRHPEVLAEVRADLSLVPAAVEEAMRRTTPTRGLPRVTTRDVVLGEQALPKGTHLLVLFASANRDDAVFPDPDTFDIRRRNLSQHLAFGKGTHFCAGTDLARLEARVTLEQFLKRLPGLRLVADRELTYVRSFVMQGLVSLELEWDT